MTGLMLPLERFIYHCMIALFIIITIIGIAGIFGLVSNIGIEFIRGNL